MTIGGTRNGISRRIGRRLAGLTSSLLIIGWAIAGAAAPAMAASASLYLSPAGGTVASGGYLTISVRENSGSTSVNAVQANLSYPADLLQYVSISSSSAYNITAPSSGGNGTVKIARGAASPVTGDQLVASVKFKALSAGGLASVSFASGSAVEHNGTDIMNGTSGGQYTLTSAAPASGSGASKDTTAPGISQVSASNPATGSIQINWVTTEPATSEVDYGLDQNYGMTAVSSKLVTNHSITVSSGLLPLQSYHYMVKSSDAVGNAASSPDETFKTAGQQLFVTVVNQNNQPVKGATVELAGQKGVTNQRGQTNLNNLPAGSQTGKVTYQGKSTSVSANVAAAGSDDEQSVTFKIETSPNHIAIIIIIVVALIVLAAAFWAVRRFWGGPPGGGEGPRASGPPGMRPPADTPTPDPKLIYPHSK